jgi:hypothetical protein
VGTYTTPRWLLANRVDTRYRRISQIDNPGIAYYDGLAVQLNKRFAKGFQGDVSYTWSHAIDLNQSSANNNIFFGATPTSYVNGDFRGDKGSAANDVRHRLAVNFVWAPKFTNSNSAFAKYFINNWQLSQITALASAPAFNSTTSISGNAYTGAPYSGSLNGQGAGFSRVPFQPVNNLDIDRVYRVDARISKQLPFGDGRVKVYLNFEAFNLFNTPYDTARRNAEYSLSGTNLVYTPSYGSPSSTAASPDGTTNRRAQVNLRVTF